MPRKVTLKGLQKKADKLFSTIGKEKAKCEVCESLPASERFNYSLLNPHHIVGRKNKTLRWNLRNRVWLCPSHHTLGRESAHNDPVWFLRWLMKNRSDDCEFLGKARNTISHYKIEDMQAIIKRLEAMK